ncbi:MAG: ABC transporter ATP-binding protein [Rubrivivax sp.]
MSFLKLDDVSKSYGSTFAVQAMNLAVAKGEFVSLLGPSGCGKTTTLQMIAGFVDVTHGRITLDGRDITHARPNSRGLGIVFQNYALFPHMTVQANVAFGLEMLKMPKPQRLDKVRAALSLVRMDGLASRYPRELSGGQRQRVALARALVIEPQVLLLDEPLSNLDAKLREEMQFELRQIHRQVGTTTVMVTHDQSEAMSISDRVVVMEGGRVTQIDAPYRLYEHPRTRFISTFVGKANVLRGPVAVNGTSLRIALGEGCVSVRPEKIRLVSEGEGLVDGIVNERFFLGSQWLYRVATPLGDLAVLAPNTGAPPFDEQAPTGLDWDPALMRAMEDA